MTKWSHGHFLVMLMRVEIQFNLKNKYQAVNTQNRKSFIIKIKDSIGF